MFIFIIIIVSIALLLLDIGPETVLFLSFFVLFVHTLIHKPRHDNTCLREPRPGPTQTELHKHRI